MQVLRAKASVPIYPLEPDDVGRRWIDTTAYMLRDNTPYVVGQITVRAEPTKAWSTGADTGSIFRTTIATEEDSCVSWTKHARNG